MNLAWFPHSSVDEVLFIIKIADTKINGTGNDVLHTFKSRMKPKNGESQMEVDSNGQLYNLKWDAYLRWSSSLYCLLRNSGRITTGKCIPLYDCRC